MKHCFFLLCTVCLFFRLAAPVYALSYLDYNFQTTEEIEDAYLDDVVDKYTYQEMVNEYNADHYDDLSEEDDCEGTGLLRFTSRANSYSDRNSGTSESLRFEWNNRTDHVDFGFLLGMHNIMGNWQYDENKNAVHFDGISKQTSLEKISVEYHGRRFSHLIVGDYKARFGLGLTFAHRRYSGEGFINDLDDPLRHTYHIYTSPDKNTSEYKTLFFDKRNLRGSGSSLDLKKAKLYAFYSNTDYYLTRVRTEHYDTGHKSLMRLNRGYKSNIVGGCVMFNLASFGKGDSMQSGVIHYKAKNKYPVWADRIDEESSAYGLYNTIKYRGLFAEVEFSVSENNGKACLVNVFIRPSHGQQAKISWRNYGTSYDNPYARAVCLRPLKTYFQCRDEQGFHLSYAWRYYFPQKKTALKCQLKSDVYSFTGRAWWDDSINQTVYAYGSKRTRVNYSVKVSYKKKDVGKIEFISRVFDRNADITGMSWASRKDGITTFVLERLLYGTKVRFSYSLKAYFLDIPQQRYYGDSFNISCKSHIKKWTVFGRIKMSDYRLDTRGKERYVYVLETMRSIGKHWAIKYSYIGVEKNDTETLSTLPDEPSVLSTGFKHKWRAALEYTW